ncbi:snaclec subunit B-like, partial [Huso huso]
AGLCAAASCHTRKYHLVQTKKNWTEARSYCREKHTDLVTMHSLEEQQQLQNIVKNEASDFKKETNNRFWIGLYQDSENWQWSTGDAVSYTNWTAGTGGLFCATADAGGSWGQSVCHDQKPFMCYNGMISICVKETCANAKAMSLCC